MPNSARPDTIESLHRLLKRLADDSAGGILEEALDVLLDCTAAQAGAAFSTADSLDPVAERGFRGRPPPSRRDSLRWIAERTIDARRLVRYEFDREPETAGLHDANLAVALAVPVEHRRTAVGVLILLFEDAEPTDRETELVTDAVASAVAMGLAIERGADVATEPGSAAARLATVAMLTASVAHELRGPVSALDGHAREQGRLIVELEKLAPPHDPSAGAVLDELRELTGDIESAARRIGETLSRLSMLAERESDHENLDLCGVIRDTLWVTRAELERRGIRLRETLSPGCLTMGRRDNLGQVVLNLVMNAAEACEAADTGSREIDVELATEGDNVVLTVGDTGAGIPQDSIRSIFEPFFKTSNTDRPAGLGLRVCRDVVAHHGGHIEVQNRRNRGAIFRVVLPRMIDDSGVHPVSVPTASKPSDTTRQIFIVDDDELFSRSLRRVLKPHVARLAATASEAEIALLDPTYDPDLVLCDIFLPGVNGDVLHQRIRARRPEVADRFLFITGGALGKSEADYLRESGRPTLFKPLDRASVLAHCGEAPPDSSPPSIRTLGRSSLPGHRTPPPAQRTPPPGDKQ